MVISVQKGFLLGFGLLVFIHALYIVNDIIRNPPINPTVKILIYVKYAVAISALSICLALI